MMPRFAIEYFSRIVCHIWYALSYEFFGSMMHFPSPLDSSIPALAIGIPSFMVRWTYFFRVCHEDSDSIYLSFSSSSHAMNVRDSASPTIFEVITRISQSLRTSFRHSDDSCHSDSSHHCEVRSNPGWYQLESSCHSCVDRNLYSSISTCSSMNERRSSHSRNIRVFIGVTIILEKKVRG